MITNIFIEISGAHCQQSLPCGAIMTEHGMVLKLRLSPPNINLILLPVNVDVFYCDHANWEYVFV